MSGRACPRRIRILSSSLPRLAALIAGLATLGGPVRADAADAPNFQRDVLPILAKNCFACHGPDEETREGGLRLDVRDAAIAPVESGETAIVPGKPDESHLVARITSNDLDLRMPPAEHAKALEPAQIATLKAWIASGAEYGKHWSFVAPTRPPLPPVAAAHEKWVRNEIDRFILAKLQAAGLEPSPEADRHALIRRLSLDLRGLPPTPGEIEAFTADRSPDAYEKLVDRFLADPAYGERFARLWLDLARYADSAGYGSDPLRTIWRYRDWVVESFNRNQPYDQFTVEQLAGDLLPNATLEQKVATAFHRNTMTNTEGGTDDEEFRVAAIKDRTDVTMQVWMGLTLGCAKCHSHKYDPLSQRDYYSFYAIFNQTADADRGDESPVIEAPRPETLEEYQRLEGLIAAAKQKLDAATPELEAAQARWEAELRHQPEWTTLRPTELAAEGAESLKLKLLDDGSIAAEGENPANATYRLTATLALPNVTAIRLETVPDPALPNHGAGRADDGNFVLSRLSATFGPDSPDAPAVGRFVRIELPGESKMLSLAEVQVTSNGINVAPAGKASQSSTDYGGAPQKAIDGETNGNYFEKNSVTHTKGERDPWWEVDLGVDAPVSEIVVWNRTDSGHGNRLNNFRVRLLDANRAVVWEQAVETAPAASLSLGLSSQRSVNFAQAAADYSQPNFAVEKALGKKADELTKTGWAVSPRFGEPHQAVFLPAQPLALSAEGPARLSITLEHRYEKPGFNLGRFRLGVTTDQNVLRRLGVPGDVLAAVDAAPESRTPEQKAKLAAHFRKTTPLLQPVRDEIAALEKSRPAAPTVPVMQELPENRRRATHLLLKGNHLTPGDAVSPAVPGEFHPFRDEWPKDRLGLAKWLVDPANPLTARVAVNRFWSAVFGAGIVETEEDFGTQGELPSHPELLDWLAIEFVEQGWDVKRLLKLIVTSAAYRQSAKVTPDMLEKDPRNRLLSRSPRTRLEAEMVRDQSLAIAGLLSRKMYGPSVFPPQPDGLWQAAFNGQRTWSTSSGEDRYRRGIYVFWRRTVPYPSMATFDAPSRETCTFRRFRTNTPLQAFVTLNDPVYVEASQAFARRIIREGGESPADRARWALALCLGRPPEEKQVERVVALYESEKAHYADPARQSDAVKLATQPLGPLPADVSAAEAAAWTVVGNVLLNLDAVLTRS